MGVGKFGRVSDTWFTLSSKTVSPSSTLQRWRIVSSPRGVFKISTVRKDRRTKLAFRSVGGREERIPGWLAWDCRGESWWRDPFAWHDPGRPARGCALSSRQWPRDPGAPTSVLTPEFSPLIFHQFSMPPILSFQCLGTIWSELGKHSCQNTWKHPNLKFSAQTEEVMNCVAWLLFSAAAVFWVLCGAFTGLSLCI